MPKIRREKLPERLLVHLLARVRQRSISHEQLILLARWLDTQPHELQDRIRAPSAIPTTEHFDGS
jgi:hypothetical protein